MRPFRGTMYLGTYFQINIWEIRWPKRPFLPIHMPTMTRLDPLLNPVTCNPSQTWNQSLCIRLLHFRWHFCRCQNIYKHHFHVMKIPGKVLLHWRERRHLNQNFCDAPHFQLDWTQLFQLNLNQILWSDLTPTARILFLIQTTASESHLGHTPGSST